VGGGAGAGDVGCDAGDGAASFGVVAVQVAEVALDQRPIAGLAAGLAAEFGRGDGPGAPPV